jgi:hypothetical protein
MDSFARSLQNAQSVSQTKNLSSGTLRVLALAFKALYLLLVYGLRLMSIMTRLLTCGTM